uniref:Ig-like domain-containing protein n=1 Tax=Pygocentrus nattereri TaxID=42514 RepID=A0AAR2JJU7_PYGNA
MPYAHFLLLEPPSFVQKLDNMSVLLGSELTMQCVLKGSLPITVSWMKDDHEVKDTEHVQISFENRIAVTDKSSMLKILSAERADEGEYTFEVSNDVGSGTCEAFVTVLGISSHVLYRSSKDMVKKTGQGQFQNNPMPEKHCHNQNKGRK